MGKHAAFRRYLQKACDMLVNVREYVSAHTMSALHVLLGD